MVTRKTLIGLVAAVILLAAACAGDDPTFEEAAEDGSTSSTTAASGESGGDESADGDGETAEESTTTTTLVPLVKVDPPPPPDTSIPPQPTAEDALAVYTGLSLDAQFKGDCANKADGDTSATLCYITDGITYSVGPSENELWYVMIVSQVDGGWVVTEVTLWALPPLPGDPATEEGA